MKLKYALLLVLVIGGALLSTYIFCPPALVAALPDNVSELVPTATPMRTESPRVPGSADQSVPNESLKRIFLPTVTNGQHDDQPPGTTIPPTPPTTEPTKTPAATATPAPTNTPTVRTYYVALSGNDNNPGSIGQPWQTIDKAVKTVRAGDTIFVRGGQYEGIRSWWFFRNSGTQAQPITLTNYHNEQVVFKIETSSYNDRNLFGCRVNPHDPPSWQTPKADYIRILGTDVLPHVLSNGIASEKGIVMQGMPGEQSAAIIAADCDYWEIAGVDFIETANAIFAMKNNWGSMEEHSTDHWYVHDNRVYNYYRESGMQFNGDDNLIENNEIYKVSNEVYSPYGCTLINILGDHNIIRSNVLSRLGSVAECEGVGFEWDLADANIVEQNLIFDTPVAISSYGGDNNIIRNNVIYMPVTPYPLRGGIEIHSYDELKTDWPCNETLGTAQAILPANDPDHPDYQYYYNPRNCQSYGNQIYNNTVHGYVEGMRISPLAGENTIVRNNVFSGWMRGGICFYSASNGTCRPLPPEVTADHNLTQEPFGFVDVQNYDFHPAPGSPLIDAGYDLGPLNPDDFDRNLRPEGANYDIGAYEYRP